MALWVIFWVSLAFFVVALAISGVRAGRAAAAFQRRAAALERVVTPEVRRLDASATSAQLAADRVAAKKERLAATLTSFGCARDALAVTARAAAEVLRPFRAWRGEMRR
jgi:hypothetical protein